MFRTFSLIDECETEGQREEYVKALQKHASVHIYGRCGAPCPGWVTEDCLKYLDQHYKVRSPYKYGSGYTDTLYSNGK